MKQLEEIKARASAATALGEWETTRANDVVIYDPNGFGAYRLVAHADAREDAEFIAASRSDVPKVAGALSDVLDRLDEWASYEPWPDAEDTQRWYSAGKRHASEAIRAIITDALEAA